MPPSNVRALHYVVKVSDRTATVAFLKDVLGMVALRHEEFEEGCKAACNGPYDGKWSKTMMGYGSEDRNFVLELTYNYTVKSYARGNDLGYIKIRSKAAFKAAQDQGLGRELDMNVLEVKDPDGHRYRVIYEEPEGDCGPLASLCLHVSNLERAAEYWCGVLGFLEVDKGDSPTPYITLSTGAADQATLRLALLPPGDRLARGTGYGRVAFSCPADQLADLQEEVQSQGYTVLTPLVRLDTPGKATVEVVILADPDGHEICFVGDEAFRELSRQDDSAPQLLGRSISRDLSKEWFEERGKRQKTGEHAEPAPPAAAVAAALAAGAAASPAPAKQSPPPAPAGAAAKAASPPPAAIPGAGPAKAAAAAPAAAAPGQQGAKAAAPAAPSAGGSPAKRPSPKNEGGKACTSS